MNNQDKEAFERWWNEEGSGMPPKPGEETEHFARRMTEIAWMNGAYVAADSANRDHCCFSCAHAQPNGRKFEMTCQNERALGRHGLPARPGGAMVWPGAPVHKLFGCKLWEAAW